MMSEIKTMAAVKSSLQLLNAAGGAGIREDALREQISFAAGGIDAFEIDAILTRLNERKWMTWHRDPVWCHIRWTITDKGALALQAM